MKKKVSNIFILLISFLSAFGCKENKNEPSIKLDGSYTPKSEYGASIGKAHQVASDLEERDKTIEQQSKGLFEE